MRVPLIIALLCAASVSFAQWNLNGTNTYYTGGNVGVGTTSPDYLFQIHSSNSPTLAIGKANYNTNGKSTILFMAGDASGSNGFWINYFKNISSDRLGFVDGGGTERMSILNGGNIGVGTSTPWNKLQIGINPSDYSGNDLVVSNANGSLAIHNDVSHTFLYANRDIAIRPGGGLMSIYAKSNGNVGVGTSTPWNKLQIGINPSGYSGNDLVVSNTNGSLAIHNDISHTYLYADRDIAIRSGGGLMSIYAKSDGNVGIGTNSPDAKLTVAGDIHSREVKVTVSAGTGPDYVFEPDYNLPTLTEIEAYIKANKHLPEVPSAKEMETNGINVSEMNMLLLKKVEELTLHLIEATKKIEKQQIQIDALINTIYEKK